VLSVQYPLAGTPPTPGLHGRLRTVQPFAVCEQHISQLGSSPERHPSSALALIGVHPRGIAADPAAPVVPAPPVDPPPAPPKPPSPALPSLPPSGAIATGLHAAHRTINARPKARTSFVSIAADKASRVPEANRLRIARVGAASCSAHDISVAISSAV